ncbi:ATP-binding protein [Acinetobacter pittii]|uniref:ATP-binding protein n=1 Tax=Acinetobacter pittii TaxID=48296 RepID=UPI001C21BCA6|nr:ATP-binding protein [Acinetobacter pittii]QXA08306.1 ATP-binding protein [Acinetobacter pittii]
MNAMISLELEVLKQGKASGICEKHHVENIVMGGYSGCPECAIEYMNEQNKKHSLEVQKTVREKHFAGAMLPERHKDAGFRNYNTSLAGQKNALTQTANFAKKIVKGEVENLVMVGSTGTGKTHLACATARTLLAKGNYARYITSEELAQRIMKAWDKDTKDQSEQSVIYEFTTYDLLILDEYGLHDRDKRLELVHKVLYSRYDACKATMLISNMTLEQLKNDLGDRLWSRFQHGGLTTIECNWKDARAV